MRSKRRIFAWLLTVVMVFSLMSNQYMYVAQAEETETSTISFSVALENAEEIVVDSSSVEFVSNEKTVLVPDMQWDEYGQLNSCTYEQSGTFYKVKVPANSAVLFTAEYTGEISTSDTEKNSGVSFYAENCESAAINLSDHETDLYNNPNYKILNNSSSSDMYYGVCVYGDLSDIELSAISPTSYTSNHGEFNQVGTVSISGTPAFYSYPELLYNDETGLNYIGTGYFYGYVYSLNYSSDNSYMIKMDYKGELDEEGNTSYYNASIRPRYDEENVDEYYLSTNIVPSVDSTVNTNYSETLPTGDVFIFLDPCDWTNVDVQISAVQNISAIKDSAVELKNDETYTCSFLSDNYEYLPGCSSGGKGCLTKVSLDAGEGCVINLDTDSQNIDTYVYQEANLGTSAVSSSCNSNSTSIYNGGDSTATYYVWIYKYNWDSAESVKVTLSDLTFVSDLTATSIKTDGTVNTVSDKGMVGSVLQERYDDSWNLYYVAESLSGTLYSMEVPGGSTCTVTYKYTGDTQVDATTISAGLSVIDGNIQLSNLFVCDTVYSDGSDGTTNSYTFVNYSSEAKTYYLFAYKDNNYADFPDGKVELSAKLTDNISSLVDGATDITNLDTFDVTVSDEVYEYQRYGSNYTARGQMLKVTLQAGKDVTYSNSTPASDGSCATAVVYKDVDGALVEVTECSAGSDKIYAVNNSDSECTYYIWCFVEDWSELDSFTMVKLKNIADLADSATVIDQSKTYTISMSTVDYMYSAYASSKGALLKMELAPNEAYVLEDAEGSACFSAGSYPIYDDSCLGSAPIRFDGYSEVVIGNATDEDVTYYIWLNTTIEGVTPESVSIVATKVDMIDDEKAEAIYANGNSATSGVATGYVGYYIERWIDNLTFCGWVDDIDAIKGNVYKVTLQPGKSYSVALDVVNAVEGTGDFTSIPTTRATIIDTQLKSLDTLYVSKYSNYPNYNTGGTGMLSASMCITNEESEAQTYYIVVSNVEAEGDVKLSVKTVPSVNTIISDALDISTYNTYSGDMTTESYDVLGHYIRNGKLVKIDVKADEKAEVSLGDNMSAARMVLKDGELVYESEVSDGLDTLVNIETETMTYYYWIYSGNDDIVSYQVTTRECEVPFLSEIEDQAGSLKVGDNTLVNSSNVITFLAKETFLYQDENGNITEEKTVSRMTAAVYQFTVPAMEKATFKLQVDDLTKDTTGAYAYVNDESTYQMGYYVYEDGIVDQREYTYSNISNSDTIITIVMPDYDFVEDSININITTEAVTPELDEDVLYVISWNNELETRMELFYEKYPEYTDKVKYMNLDCSGTGEYVDYVKNLLTETADNTAIFALDIDVVGELLPEDGFVALDSIGFDTTKYDNAYDYTVDMGTVDGKLKALSWSVEPGNFVYNTAIAEEVLGTSDPAKVQEYLTDPETFLETAELMKEAGYYMTSGEDMISNLGRYTFSENESKTFAASIGDGGYSTGNQSWSTGWTNDMVSGKVFGFFGCTWFMYWSMQYTDNIDMAVCEGPIEYPWGGTFLGVSSNHSNEDNDKLAAFVLETLCCDEEYMYENSAYVDGDVIVPNNQKVTLKLIAEGKGTMSELADSQNPLPIWHNVAMKIGKGEWESKCTDKKYVINVDSNKQIDLSSNEELALAGFVYDNFTGLAEENANATLNDGVLTVTDPDKVVRYIYTEKGVSRELQFIACVQAADGTANSTVKVEEDVVVETDKDGNEVSKTTTYVEVTDGEISGQIDEIEINTGDEKTTITVTENKDILGEVVEDASIVVTQETISEDTLKQSIEVANSKSEEYKNSENEEEQKVSITEIKAEFTDDTDADKTEVSAEIINQLKDSEITLEISKVDGDGKVEYKWTFDKDSMKEIADSEVKAVNTKLTVHKEDNSYEYQEDVNELTQDDAINCILEFAHEGILPGETTITVSVADKYDDGKVIYYYHYDTENKQLTYVGQATVQDGYVPVKLSHCSDYVVTDKVAVLATGVDVKIDATTLEIGDEATFTATVSPEGAMSDIEWTSSDETVVSVDKDGNITALKAGTATITATVADGSGVTKSVTITVNAPKVPVTSVTISSSSVSIEKGKTATLTVKVKPDNASNKTITWTSSNTSVATVDKNGKVTALKAGTATITAITTDGSGKSAKCTITVTEPVADTPVTPDLPDTINVSYVTHIQDIGWENDVNKSSTWKSNGVMSGTTGKSKRLEGINIVVASGEEGKTADLGIQYTTHCQTYGWLPWSADGEMSGTEGESKRLEAIMIKLTGDDAEEYDVYYRVHAQNYGWLGWAKNGAPAGTAGSSLRLEGIQIVVLKKGSTAPGVTYAGITGSSTSKAYYSNDNTTPTVAGADTTNVKYKTHVQDYGWQGFKYNGTTAGTSGQSKRLEGIEIELTNQQYSGDIVYTTHVQNYGWQGDLNNQSTWKKNGIMSGTSGQSLRLEAICIDLTGEMADNYDIYYRVHAQDYGWLSWAKNGASAGTAGYSKRLEAIQIVLVPKGGNAPANNYGGVTSTDSRAYIEK